MRLFRSRQTEAWYAAVYRSGPSAELPIEVAVEPGPLSQWLVTIELAGRRYVHRVPRMAGSKKTQG
ncbi:MAG: hypothetical protein ACYC6Y_12995 [Thermoguttaceae bacterium]